jgi:uncharacterized protein (DUF305 family)
VVPACRRLRRGPGWPVVALILWVSEACGGAAALTEGGAAKGGGSPSDAAESDAAELEALFRSRTDSALARFTPDDVEFRRRMIVHHEQALSMARLAPARGAGPAVRTLAARTINAQRDEIDLMRRWLEDRGQVQGPPATSGMPGMLTPENMRELEGATGPSFDRLFLSYMVRHHQGAISMVEDLFATAGAAQDASVFRIGSGIRVDQATEIARMERMLAEMPDPP